MLYLPPLAKITASLILAASFFIATLHAPPAKQGEKGSVIMTSKKQSPELEGQLIFDNGGGLTVQLPGYAHWYQNPAQAAEDIDYYIQHGNTDGWDGHDEDAAELDPSYDQIRNGGYRIYSIPDILDETESIDASSWGNIVDFCTELKKIMSAKKS